MKKIKVMIKENSIEDKSANLNIRIEQGLLDDFRFVCSEVLEMSQADALREAIKQIVEQNTKH